MFLCSDYELKMRKSIFNCYFFLVILNFYASYSIVTPKLLRIFVSRSHNVKTENYEAYASDVLTTAVLAILLTAPLGAIAIQLLGRKLLRTSLQSQLDEKVENGSPQTENEKQIKQSET